MKIEKVLKPGQSGTTKLVEKYGKDLVCIRYRVDKAGERRLKTAEIIVNEKPVKKKRKRIPANKLMHLKINYNDIYLRRIVKSAGGRWNSVNKVWELSYDKVIDLELEKNVLESL